jgi:Dolichyl-phosphate-mannose-protein mannosyltransferase
VADRRRRIGAFELGVAACTLAVGVFLTIQLDAWAPHEDETLALFVGRGSLHSLYDTVLGHRGGAPLHFMVAWAVAHLGGGLLALRACSALFATASVPLIAILANRLAGRRTALITTVIVSASWVLLFHGVYGRMYSLFLLTSVGSYIAFMRAIRRFRPLDWEVWVATIYFTLASHPYGALVFASQVLFVLIDRTKVRASLPAIAAVVVLGIPFWRSDLVLAGRFDVGVGGGGQKLGGPTSVLEYFWHTVGDFTTGYEVILAPLVIVAALGLWRLRDERPQSALLAALVFWTPGILLVLTRFGSSSTSPETRHLIFALPFFVVCLAVGLQRLRMAVVLLTLTMLVPAEIAWGEHRSPQLYRHEPAWRVSARDAASDWLAATSRPDDILFGYDPLFLQAWEKGGHVSRIVLPRADPDLLLSSLRDEPQPLGRGVWVFDASDSNNFARRSTIKLRYPYPRSAFEVRRYGPFLVIRSRRPTRTIYNYLAQAWNVELDGKSLYMGDADVNHATVRKAIRRLAVG